MIICLSPDCFSDRICPMPAGRGILPLRCTISSRSFRAAFGHDYDSALKVRCRHETQVMRMTDCTYCLSTLCNFCTLRCLVLVYRYTFTGDCVFCTGLAGDRGAKQAVPPLNQIRLPKGSCNRMISRPCSVSYLSYVLECNASSKTARHLMRTVFEMSTPLHDVSVP